MCQMSDLNHFGQEKSCKHHVNLLEAAKDLAHLTPPHLHLHPHHHPAPTPSTDVTLNSQPIPIH